MLRKLFRQWGWFVLLNRSQEKGVIGTMATVKVAERLTDDRSH